MFLIINTVLEMISRMIFFTNEIILLFDGPIVP